MIALITEGEFKRVKCKVLGWNKDTFQVAVPGKSKLLLDPRHVAFTQMTMSMILGNPSSKVLFEKFETSIFTREWSDVFMMTFKRRRNK